MEDIHQNVGFMYLFLMCECVRECVQCARCQALENCFCRFIPNRQLAVSYRLLQQGPRIVGTKAAQGVKVTAFTVSCDSSG